MSAAAAAEADAAAKEAAKKAKREALAQRAGKLAGTVGVLGPTRQRPFTAHEALAYDNAPPPAAGVEAARSDLDAADGAAVGESVAMSSSLPPAAAAAWPQGY